jgi:Tfp pilus assembly protein PilX
MKRTHSHGTGRGRQRGATLIVALIMIALITLLVINAFTLSSSNFKAVTNMQMRDESVAAANQAVEQLIGSAFHTALATRTFTVDINKDGTDDFTVVTAKPSCIRAFISQKGAPSDVELGKALASGSTWNTDWDVEATVTDTASGAAVKIHQGVRALLTLTEKETYCP